MNKVSIFFGHVAGNVGDIAINEGEHRLLRAAFPDAHLQFVTLRAAKSQFIDFAMPSMQLDDNTSVVHFMPQSINATGYVAAPETFLEACTASDADLIVLAAGEHVFSYANNTNTFNLFWRTLPLYVAKRLGIAVISMPATYGPFETSPGAELARLVAKMADDFSVRDVASSTEIADLVAEPVLVRPDPAFWLTSVRAKRQSGLYVFAMRSEGWGIRLNKALRDESTEQFSQDNYRDSLAFQYNLAVAKEILATSGSRITFAIQTLADEELSASVVKALADDYPGRVSLYRPTSIADYLLLLGSAQCVITSRFHAVIMAIVSGTPAIASYFPVHGHKMPGLLALLDSKKHCVEITPDNLQQAVLQSVEVLAATCNMLPVANAKLQQLRTEYIANLSHVVITSADSADVLKMSDILVRLAAELMLEGIQASQNKVSRQHASRLKVVQADTKNLQKRLDASVEDLNVYKNKSTQTVQQLQKEQSVLEQKLKDSLQQLELLTRREVSMKEQNAFFQELYEDAKAESQRLKRMLGIPI
ncbi:polysaccharide pyruvyl transferase family protein [Rheinheimera baltica]|uniref:Polysaccharide pyruvyl transferase family protein n=1 Tax=Rheinheimera baltica TaxID=67576 RepID=A0ABT9I3C8_9GAMM|nr:polysaccharide pyruvyl transferase family protein [Rheinheimera baltica]MDP5137885.1 polysaccharide pyruvyl transferase family protein [Rheinheimera baltica]MDP5149768.1 polysaccharide pyruvyl transferase family protein [Rheinheimera baltica]